MQLQATTADGKPRCQALTKSGSQCTRPAEPGSQFCWQHQDYIPGTSNKKPVLTGPSIYEEKNLAERFQGLTLGVPTYVQPIPTSASQSASQSAYQTFKAYLSIPKSEAEQEASFDRHYQIYQEYKYVEPLKTFQPSTVKPGEDITVLLDQFISAALKEQYGRFNGFNISIDAYNLLITIFTGLYKRLYSNTIPELNRKLDLYLPNIRQYIRQPATAPTSQGDLISVIFYLLSDLISLSRNSAIEEGNDYIGYYDIIRVIEADELFKKAFTPDLPILKYYNLSGIYFNAEPATDIDNLYDLLQLYGITATEEELVFLRNYSFMNYKYKNCGLDLLDYVNTLVVKSNLSPNPTYKEFLDKISSVKIC